MGKLTPNKKKIQNFDSIGTIRGVQKGKKNEKQEKKRKADTCTDFISGYGTWNDGYIIVECLSIGRD